MAILLEFFRRIFASDFVSHGHCYFWNPGLVWLHSGSDGLIALSYLSIAVSLFYFVRKRPQGKMRGLILMFAGFILACGATHAMAVWNIWHSTYRLEGVMKATTALLSVATAIVTVKLGPVALTMLTDETERRKAARELARANQQLRSYLEAASQAIVSVSKDGRIVLVNRLAEEMFDYPRDQLVGQQLEMLLPARFREGHSSHPLSFFAEPRVRPIGPGMELAGLRKDGTEFPLEIGLSFVETEEGTIVLGLISDITERKRAADLLASANADLVRSNIELEQFAYSASHDLQEPLRMVTGYLNLLDRRYGNSLDEDAREFIRYAVDGASRMKGLIQDLLSVSRISSQAVDMHLSSSAIMLQNAVDNLTIAIEESGAAVTSDALPEVLADGDLLTLVFQNLIGNAIKFHGQAPPRVYVSARREGPQWIFSVRDNGIGIEPRHSERIFRIFERLNDPEKYSGTGIGLAITQRIVARHGGKIWVESHIGEGSTFFFAIPVGRKPA